MNETKNVGVPLTIPILVPGDELIQNYDGQLPATTEKLIESGWLTKEEALSYHNYHMNMCEIASNMDEFLNIYRAVKQELSRKESGIILPGGY